MDPLVFAAVLAAAVMHAGWNAVVKLDLDRFSAILLLSMMQSGIALLLLAYAAVPAPPAWPWIAASAFLHAGYKLFLIRAYGYADLSQVYPLARGAAPLIVTLVGFAVIGEVLSAAGFLGVLAIACGVGLMAFEGRGGRKVASRAGLAYALGTAAFTAAYTLVDGMGARIAGTATGYTMWMFVGDGVVMAAIAAFGRGRRAFAGLASSWRSGLVAGGLSLGSYWIAVWAFTREAIALVAALRETSVLFAMLIAVVFLRERAGPWRWSAAALIGCGLAGIRM